MSYGARTSIAFKCLIELFLSIFCQVYGLNEIFIPLKGVMTLLFLEVLNPFYVFQVFSVCLWFSYSYYYYAVVIILMSIFGISMTILQTRKNQLALKQTCSSNDSATVMQLNGCSEVLDTKYLVPGDLLEIPKNGCIMQCDAVLLSGNCILDESLLTGECVPVTKTPIPYQKDVIFNRKEHSRHMLYSGTKIIQTRYIGTEKVLARVINTGNITTKGGLIRSILYPPPVDYKFEQDSYKFIMLLGAIAGCGFIYTLWTKVCTVDLDGLVLLFTTNTHIMLIVAYIPYRYHVEWRPQKLS